MSHWAELDENSVVKRVLVCDNNDPNGDEGYQWLINTFGGRWIQTSYNNNFRGHFAGIGMLYHEDYDVFINAAPPYPSWHLDPETKDWAAPQPMPGDGFRYEWDEPSLSWLRVDKVFETDSVQ